MHKPIQLCIWDPLIRIFHWSLLAAFTTSWFTQQQHYNLHLQAGYSIFGLIILRFIWGFIGPKYAQFSDFIYPPVFTIHYIKAMIKGKSERFVGHNPLAGIMIITLLVNLLILTTSGIALDGAENWSGPMAEMNLFQYKNLIQFTHSISTDMLIMLIIMHISGVIYSSWRHKENLIKSMLTGRKNIL